MAQISFHVIDLNYSIKNIASITGWIKKTALQENKKFGTLNFILCSDNYLLKINQQYLKHDTYTDIITFPYTDKDAALIDGDIYISIDRINENAIQFECSPEKELKRVIIHGALHLLGYKDKTIDEAKTMRSKEDFYLSLF